ncbi:MAG: hypothetical protein ACLUE1_06395 [Adlercreutzia equolifaciens]
MPATMGHEMAHQCGFMREDRRTSSDTSPARTQ